MNLRQFVRGTGLALAGLALISTQAFAAVTFDPDTGKGFVGKGDVQSAFEWNNRQLQNRADGVSFTFDALDSYSAVCTWITGEGTRGEKTHDVDHKRSTAVKSKIDYEARTANQITGFILKGFGTTTESGVVPVVGEACPGNAGTDGTWTSVDLVSSTGGLFVNYNGKSVELAY